MHDIDRALFETEQTESPGGYELAGEAYETTSSDTREMALAGELLEITTEAELDRFLGDLVQGAVSAARTFANSDAGRAVGGLLKSAAKQALPRLGQAVGDWVAPGIGGTIGSKLGSFVGSRLELEGLSQEDREFEAARAYVRFANEAVQRAASAPPGVPPAQAAVQAATVAAQRQLPGLVPVIQRLVPPGGSRPRPRGHSGHWVRRGSTIVLFNV